MRVTNNMMLNTTTKNVNATKVNQNKLNNQMSSQKKIQRPSEDPVVAIRALRFRSTLSQINQYCDRNIPDALNWLETTETALYNMNKMMGDVRTQCVNGTNSYMTQDDRKTILQSLTALKKQIYSEGNAQDAGRTVFTGFRTNSQLTFMEDSQETSYDITQSFGADQIEEYKYLTGNLSVPGTAGEILQTANITDTNQTAYNRIRLAYDDLTSLDHISYTTKENTKVTFQSITAADGSVSYERKETDAAGEEVMGGSAAANGVQLKVYENEDEWAKANGGEKKVDDYSMVLIKSTGDLIMGKEISAQIKSDHANVEVSYNKTGFEKGELRPEFYYNCTDKTDPANPITYHRYDENGNRIYEDINFTVAMDQTLTINLQADEVFDMSIEQDIIELTNSVQRAIDAHEKVDKIESMMKEVQYKDYTEELEQWLAAAKKEADYADQNMTDLYSAGIGKFDKYIDTLNIAYTEVGARGDQLEMTQSRLSNQQLTVEELKSENEDRELSDIIIDYTAAYNAYQAALMAASKVEKQTLLDYI